MDFKSLLSKLDNITSIKTLNEGWEDMMKASKEKSKKDTDEKGTGKFDKKETGTGTVYTRKSSTFDDGGEDKDVKKAKKKEKKVKEDQVDEAAPANQGANMDDVPAYVRKQKEQSQDAAQTATDERNKKAGVDVWSSKRATNEDAIRELQKIAGIQVDESKKPDEDGDGVPDWADKKPGKDDNDDDKSDDDKDDDKSNDDKDDDKEKVDESLQECYDQAMSQMPEQESGVNISSNMDTKTGSQSLSVTAQGESAEQLAQLLKLSGLLGGASEPQEIELEVDESEYANEPQPAIQGMATQFQQGNDLNRQKQSYPKVAGGDNPMQRAIAAMEAKAEADLNALERQLTEQLNSLKIVSKKK